MREQYRAVAYVVKTHGKQGEVVITPIHNLPSVIARDMTVIPVPPALTGPRSLEVTKVVSDTRHGSLVSFADIDSLGDAKNLVGKTLLVRQADLSQDFALHDVNSLLGREVIDAHFGLLGTLSEVLFTPAHDVWVVKSTKKDILIPVVGAYIREVPSAGALYVEVPAGFVGEKNGEDA